MVDREELQQKARLVESHRQHLEELQKRMEEVSAVVSEHQVTAEILNRLTSMAESGESKAHVTIGAGVTLHYKHEQPGQGTALIDLGSGIFGEREWSDAAEIIDKRKEEFIQLHETLLKQASSIEERLGTLATEFNQAAEKLQTIPPPVAKAEQIDPEPQSESKPSKRKRGSRFGGELTLDD